MRLPCLDSARAADKLESNCKSICRVKTICMPCGVCTVMGYDRLHAEVYEGCWQSLCSFTTNEHAMKSSLQILKKDAQLSSCFSGTELN